MEAVAVALIGVFGALLGVIVTEWRRARREERMTTERRRGAARMISAELGIAALLAASDRPFWVLGTLPSAAWKAHGADLAQALSDEDFAAVVEAAVKVEAARSLFSSVSEVARLEGLEAVVLDPLVEKCRRAQDVLSSLAYPSQSRTT